jgi:hypothetical protein
MDLTGSLAFAQRNNIGSIKRLMIEKISSRVAYAVMSFCW